MKKEKFKQSLLRGQGRCLIAVKQNPTKYYNDVMWACSRSIAYDPQCEGTRSHYVYELIKCYDDTTPFLDKIIAELAKTSSVDYWRILYFAELLNCFYYDGSNEARGALWRKYEELYAKLLKRKRRPTTDLFFDRDAFERLCITLIDDAQSAIRIAEDIGKLYCEKTVYYDDDFDWLLSDIKRYYIKALRKAAKKSRYVARFVQLLDTFGKYLESIKSNAQNTADREVKRTETPYEKLLAQYLNETDCSKRAAALRKLQDKYTSDPDPVITDATSDNEELRCAAFNVLEGIRHIKVRNFILTYMTENIDDRTEIGIPIFIKNYNNDYDDELALTLMVMTVPVDFDNSSNWHSIHMDVLSMGDNRMKTPTELLDFIYEKTYCSCCRESALKIMSKRRLLTQEILQECLYDSSEEIREFAQKRLKKLQ